MRTFVWLSMLALVLPVFTMPAEAAGTSCDFRDTSFSNTSYTTGPGVLSAGNLYASAHVRPSDTSTAWGMATGRVNGAIHHLSEGTWTITFSSGSGSGNLAYSGGTGVEGVIRVGWQIERFNNLAIEGDVSASQDLVVAPQQGPATFPAGELGWTIDVPAGGADLDGLFFVDTHVRHDANEDISASFTWSADSICWSKQSTTSLTQVVREIASTGAVFQPAVAPASGMIVLAPPRT